MTGWIEQIEEVVSRFDLATARYNSQAVTPSDSIEVSGLSENAVYYRGDVMPGALEIQFSGCQNSRVFIGRGFKGNASIRIQGNDSLIYIGNGCSLKSVEVRSRPHHDTVVIGNNVTTSGTNTWISGVGAGAARPALIIGDDCMFSYDIVVRNSDAHPIFEIETGRQVNEPASAVILEPHVWVGERSSILKDVRIGACSVVALGSIVTRSMPRFSQIRGVPAKGEVKEGLLWARKNTDASKAVAREYAARYLGKCESDGGGPAETR